jgi:hypothetical protein
LYKVVVKQLIDLIIIYIALLWHPHFIFMKLACRFLRVRFVGRRSTSCKFLIDMLENVLPLDVLDDLVVEAWSKATDA